MHISLVLNIHEMNCCSVSDSDLCCIIVVQFQIVALTNKSHLYIFCVVSCFYKGIVKA